MEKRFETVIYEKIDNVAKITMNRPEKRNAQNYQMTLDIDAALSEGVADDEVKVMILLAKQTVNEALDIMGFKTAANNAFKAHQIAHGHHAELGTGGMSITRPDGMSVSQWAREMRDKAYQD